MDSKLRKMGILASMAVILLVALAVMYVNREQLSPTSGQNTEVSGAQNAGDGEAVDPVPEGTGETSLVCGVPILPLRSRALRLRA